MGFVRVFRVELELLLRSRYLVVGFALLLLYAVVMAWGYEGLFRRLMGEDESFRTGNMFIYMSLQFCFYPLYICLVMAFTSVSVTQEVQTGTLRYSLITPIARWQYLLAKYLTTVVAALLLLFFLFFVVAGIGLTLFGTGRVFTMMALAEGRVPALLFDEVAFQRAFLYVPLAAFTAVGLSSFAFFISTISKNMVVAIAIPLCILFMSWIIQNSPFLEWMEPYLITRYMNLWDWVFARDIGWPYILDGVAFYAMWIFVFVGGSFAVFLARDVTD